MHLEGIKRKGSHDTNLVKHNNLLRIVNREICCRAGAFDSNNPKIGLVYGRVYTVRDKILSQKLLNLY